MAHPSIIQELQKQRYYTNPTNVTFGPPAKPHAELIECLERIDTFNPPVHTCSTDWKFQGFYTGPTSIGYLYYRLSQFYPELLIKRQSMADYAHEYLKLGGAQGNSQDAPTPSNCGIGNETLAHLTLTALLNEDESAVDKLCSYELDINDKDDNGSNEWLYGRAGYLYLLRACKTSLTRINHAKIDLTIAKTVCRMLEVPKPWLWKGKHYLGAAHGTIGSICQIVLSMPEMAPRLQGMFASLLDQQFRATGNFPSSLPRGDDKLVQFCHGGPGFVLSLRSLRPHFPSLQARVDEAIRFAQEDTFMRGWLIKTPCLCHGIAGNALALDREEDFVRFVGFMTTAGMIRGGWMMEIEEGLNMSSLYTGEAGRAWLWAVADQGINPKTCIGYNDV
ncbi:glucose transporter rco-3 [Apiospora arundinis]